MTDEQMRIAIAEACGFTHVRCVPPDHCLGHHPDRPSYVPDYLNDLNAMREAEEQVPPNLRARWYLHLCAVSGDSAWNTSRATARQRAEAFLRTLNLWESTK